MATEFEEAVRLSGGWVDLALPSAEDAARYFASFRRAPPDNSALVPGPQVLHGSFELGSILSTLSVLVDVLPRRSGPQATMPTFTENCVDCADCVPIRCGNCDQYLWVLA